MNPGTKQTTDAAARPVCDEWGLYDPEQAGLQALVRRLDPEEDEARAGIDFAPEPRGVHSLTVSS